MDPTDARSLILKRRHKRRQHREPGGGAGTLRMRLDTRHETRLTRHQSDSDEYSAEEQSEEEEEDFET